MLPTYKEFKKRLQESFSHLKECDSRCDFDMELARWQEYVNKWPPILDENGGL